MKNRQDDHQATQYVPVNPSCVKRLKQRAPDSAVRHPELMTARPGPGTPQRTPLPPALNFTVTHVGLGTSRLDSVQHKGLEVEIKFASQRVVLIALSAEGGTAEGRQLSSFFGWPKWQAPSIPSTTHEWQAVFGAQTRAFEGIYRAAPEGEKPTVIRTSAHFPVTPAMWQMIQESNCVVLCTGLAGDPTAAEFVTASADGRLQAVLAYALVG